MIKDNEIYYLQWLLFENQQRPIYVVNCHFSRHPDHSLALLTHINHIYELSNEVLYDPVYQGVSKIKQVKFQSLTFVQ